MVKTSLKWRKLDFTKNVTPLFDEFYEYVVSITNSEIAGDSLSSRNTTTVDSSANTAVKDVPDSQTVEQEDSISKVLKVNGSIFEVEKSTFDKLPKYQILINKKNHLDRSGFVDKYVNKYLKSNSFKDVIETPDVLYSMVDKVYEVGNQYRIPTGVAQVVPLNSINETAVEKALLGSLYNLIRPLVNHSLELHRKKVLHSFKNKILKRGCVKLESGTGRIDLTPGFTEGKAGAAFYGLHMKPDLEVGYFAQFTEPEKLLPVFYTNIVKYTTFQLQSCIELLANDGKNAESYLFVKLEFKKEKNVVDGYATDESKGGTFIKCQYTHFTKAEPYIRLYFLSFCAVDEDYLKELAKFQLLIRKNSKQAALAKNENYPTSGTALNPVETGSSTGKSGEAKNKTSSSNKDSKKTDFVPTPPASEIRQLSSAKHFNKYLFEDPSYGRFCDVITNIVEIGLRASQVVKVDATKFSKLILRRNMCVKGPLPDKCILKVYDPFIGQLVKSDEWGDIVPTTYTYQRCIDFTVREAKGYCALSEFSGDFIPRMYAYGRLSDLYPDPDPLYLQLCGGYLSIEALEKDDEFKVTAEFFNDRILPAYQKMHSRDVLQNDIKWDNVIITKDGEFIIDFGHSKISTDEAAKKAELDLVYEKLRFPER